MESPTDQALSCSCGTGFSRLLDFARLLEGATSARDLLALARDEVEASTGYRTVWFYLLEPGAPDRLRLVHTAGGQSQAGWEHAELLKVEGDPMLEELVSARSPVVVEDARSDPRTNKQIVRATGARTLVGIPMMMADHPMGAFGTGTFEGEECRAPSPAQLSHLVGVGQQLAVALTRLRLAEERGMAQAEREQLLQRLLAAQRMETIRLLAAGAVHDLKGLLAAMQVHSKLLSQGLSLEEQQRHALGLNESIRLAVRIVDPLLAAERRPSQRVPVDLSQLLMELQLLVTPLLPSEVKLEILTEPGLAATILGDSALLHQMLINLVLNARDAMCVPGQVTIVASQHHEQGELGSRFPWVQPGTYVKLSVTDQGVGIPAELIDRVFEPFFTTRQDGTGLGLAICAGIARQHGGTVTCQSEVGAGSTFQVYLLAAAER